ncbi:MAG: hypothetical protein ACR2JU_14625 [Nocardioidaceae bacterium]
MAYDAAQPDEQARAAPVGPARSTRDPAGSSDAPVTPLVVDCDTCRVRGIGCGDCVVTVLLGGPPSGVSLNDEERRAVEVLAAAGLVPPLRLVDGLGSQEVETA